MTPAARYASAIEILDQWMRDIPLEAAYQSWARRARYAGSGDRSAIRDLIYDAVRRRRSYAALGGAETARGIMIGAVRAQGIPVSEVFNGKGHGPEALTQQELGMGRAPGPIEGLDCPEWLIPSVQRVFEDRTPEILDIMRSRARSHLRVNLAATDRESVIADLAKAGVTAVPHPEVSSAVIVTDGQRRIAASPVIEDGLAELQDASSQQVVAYLCDRPINRVLDYCAGAGGKTLAFADMTDAHITAHDIAIERLTQLPFRAERAGAEVEICPTEALSRRPPFDLVFCDAPCSGSGTWRRDPEAKWWLQPDRLRKLCEIQREILEFANSYVAVGGRLAYATCSILAEENEDQAARFVETFPEWVQTDEMRIDPHENGDGFYLAVFERRHEAI